ncbi:MAG TPA: carboxypeptidase regulatory-like domain-containing protein [Candidatus Thermoplasmatota archaeon]|nr:carboxypeptidase regulatory-like domain-containing protein [Candidatus Thermoplasmatota archaeon]
MKVSAFAAGLSFLLLAGCSGGGGAAPAEDVADFEDLGVAPTATTGVILGIVVDSSIRPVAEATVKATGAGQSKETTTDEEGRFAFGALEPGTYLLAITHPLYLDAQSSAEVAAGLEDPPITRVLLDRRFTQDPFSETLKFEGFIACGFNAGTVAPCVTDFTQVLPPCGGGCFPELRTVMGDRRDYLTSIGPGWQQLIIEMTWEPSAQATSPAMGFVVSHPNRTGAAHSFGEAEGPNPIRWQADVGEEAPGAASQEPTMIPAEGWPDLLVFSNVRSSDAPAAVTVQQSFTIFQNNFYYGTPPEGWSFIAGDEPPF